jgi:aryl-alcohol dehydrogenase-like predicted oxidoreductase
MIYKKLGATEFAVSAAGFGCYRVDVSIPEHHQALELALLSGINLIDTSANYANGGSEELVGVVLKKLVAEKQIKREDVVVVSKVGYLQGQNYQLSQQRKRAEKPFLDLVEYGHGLEHCIHPEFIADQLTRALQRLQMDKLEVYLLHNPEYYLNWAQHHGVALEQARGEYYRRIKLAFEYLETEVQAGRISYYGISSNTFAHSSSDFDFTSLEKVYEIAQSRGAKNHFQVIQLPLNLIETGGATEQNQRGGAQTVLEFAHEKKLGVLINRPLNGIKHDQLIRLSNVLPQAKEIQAYVEKLNEGWRGCGTLSQLAIRTLRSTQGIHVALVGMRREEYVRDVLAELEKDIVTQDRFKSWLSLKEMFGET